MLALLLLVVSCEEDEPKVWDVYYEVVLQNGSGGEYRVTYSGSRTQSVQQGGLTDSFWESQVQEIEDDNEISMLFERLSGTGEYRIRIYVGGSHVREATIPNGLDSESIFYLIPSAR